MDEVLTLIQQTHDTDEYGDPKLTETRTDVFARLASIGQKEFYQAHAVGLQPELKFILSDYLDYNGEKLVEHEGQRYRVLRTYRSGLEMELVVYREVNAA